MAAASGTDSYSGVQEKENYHVQRSSLGESNEAEREAAYVDKDAVPVNIQESNISGDASSDSIKEVFDVEAIDPVLSKKKNGTGK
jgi:hypothetical protein